MTDLVPKHATAAAQTVGTAIRAALTRIDPLDAQVLLALVLGRSRTWVLTQQEGGITPPEQTQFEALVSRRMSGEPLAYLTGHREFWSLNLKVSAAVLVPRPETELVVERALALVPNAMHVADLGTGSGAIALALATERPEWHITATDHSTAALDLASANAAALGIHNVRWLCGDWLHPLSGMQFDLIASNPPYVSEADPAMIDSALRHEPRDALVAGPDGLDDLSRIIGAAGTYLRTTGWLVLEHGATQAQAVADLLVHKGFRHVRCHTDLAGLPRVTEAQNGHCP